MRRINLRNFFVFLDNFTNWIFFVGKDWRGLIGGSTVRISQSQQNIRFDVLFSTAGPLDCILIDLLFLKSYSGQFGLIRIIILNLDSILILQQISLGFLPRHYSLESAQNFTFFANFFNLNTFVAQITFLLLRQKLPLSLTSLLKSKEGFRVLLLLFLRLRKLILKGICRLLLLLMVFFL